MFLSFLLGGVGVPGRCKVDAKMYGNEVCMMPPGIGWGIPGMTLTDVFLDLEMSVS